MNPEFFNTNLKDSNGNPIFINSKINLSDNSVVPEEITFEFWADEEIAKIETWLESITTKSKQDLEWHIFYRECLELSLGDER